MKLTLTVTNSNLLMENQSPEYTFTELGGSIGRNPLNDWVICDHKRFISGKHAEIFFRDNTFFITDTSTNGVYLNERPEAIGKGNSIPLSEGDVLSFGELKIAAHIETEQKPIDSGTGEQPGEDLFADLLGDFGAPADKEQEVAFEPVKSETDIDSLIGVSSTPELGAEDIEVTDPLAILDGKTSEKSDYVEEELKPDEFSQELLGGSDLNTPFKPEFKEPEQAESESVIPDNWDPLADLMGEPQPSTPPPSQPPRTQGISEAEQTQVNDELDILDLISGEKQPTPSQPQVSETVAATPPVTTKPASRTASFDMVDTILSAAGLNPSAYSPEQKQQLPALIGVMLRGCLDGLVTALMARNQVKSGLRMAVTTIAPVENNPLKFSVNGEEALRNLLNAREGYLGPKEAISEGYQDLQIHQLAMMSATQKTLQALVQHFNPELLSQQFEQTKSSGLKLGTKKMHYWDQYQEVYKNIEETINEDFQNLLGDVFADAYEEQTVRAKQNL